jgi:hypothetical protein
MYKAIIYCSLRGANGIVYYKRASHLKGLVTRALSYGVTCQDNEYLSFIMESSYVNFSKLHNFESSRRLLNKLECMYS